MYSSATGRVLAATGYVAQAYRAFVICVMYLTSDLAQALHANGSKQYCLAI